MKKKQKISPEEINKKIEAIVALMNHWGWESFAEIILHIQTNNMLELFTKQFLALAPDEKDKRHRVIVEVNMVLDRLLQLPQWLEKKQPQRWGAVINHITTKEEQ